MPNASVGSKARKPFNPEARAPLINLTTEKDFVESLRGNYGMISEL